MRSSPPARVKLLDRVVLLGARGDLTRRYVLPGFAALLDAGRLPDGFEIVAVDRGEATIDEYRDGARQWLRDHASDVAPAVRTRLLALITYHCADAAEPVALREVVQPDRGPVAVYMALPPSVVRAVIEALTTAGLPTGSRIGVEKPFGASLQHARELNELLRRCVGEHAVFRIDHFLAMQTVQNLLGLRFANRVFESVWNAEHVARVDVVWDETLTLEGRAYYDEVGAVRDLVQNHLLQLLALVAMEPPTRLDAGELGDRKADVLRAVRRLAPEEVARRTVRGRYTAGRIDGRPVRAYVEEELVDPARETETFAEVTLDIDNWRWSGVPFVLRTGKALGVDRREIVVRFRPVPLHRLTGVAAANVLRIPLDPEVLTLEVNINAPGDAFALQRVHLSQQLAAPDLPAYARVLLGLLAGDRSLSIRGDEAEESWEIVEPILEAWARDLSPLVPYPAGSTGPQSPAMERANL